MLANGWALAPLLLVCVLVFGLAWWSTTEVHNIEVWDHDARTTHTHTHTHTHMPMHTPNTSQSTALTHAHVNTHKTCKLHTTEALQAYIPYLLALRFTHTHTHLLVAFGIALYTHARARTHTPRNS